MSIQDGNPVNASYTNDKLASKEDDNTLEGKQTLTHNNVESGADILDIQKTVNDLIAVLVTLGAGDSMANIGGGAGEIYKEKVATQFRVRTLAGANSVTVAINGDVIDIGHPIEFLAADPGSPVNPSVWFNYTEQVWKSWDGAITTEIGSDYVDLSTNQSVGGEKTFSADAFFSQDVTVTGDFTVNGTTTTVNTATLEVTDQNITVNNTGNDASAEGAGLTVERTGTDGSFVYEDALDNKFKAGALGSENELAAIIKDTEANILAISPGSTSRRYYATDTGKHYIWDNVKTEMLEIGSGSGIGSPSIYGLFNAEDEELAGFTGAAINSSTPLAGEFSYDLTLPGNTPLIPAQERSLNKLNELRLQVRIASGTAKAIVKDQASNVLAESEFSEDGTIALQWFMSSTITDVQLFWEDVSSGTGITVDDIHCDDNPLNFKTTITQEGWSGNTHAGYGSTDTKIPYLTNIASNTTGNFITVTNDSTNGLQVVANKDCSVMMDYSWDGSTGAQDIGISLNSSQLTTNISSILAADRRAVCREENVGGSATVSVNLELLKGDVLRPHSNGSAPGSATNSHINILAVANSENVVGVDSGTENTFAAKIQNNGTASIISQHSDFIASVNRSALGIVDIVFTASFFSQAPSVTVTGGGDVYKTSSITASGCTVTSRTDAGVNNDTDFDIDVHNQGTDYKDPHAFALDTVIKEKIKIFDGVPAPGVEAYAQMYIDQADGDLKIKFSDGTVKTIVVDT